MKVGVLGAGQLARMLALAGHPLGMSFVFVDPNPRACAGALGQLIVAEYDDAAALQALAASVDLVTLDFENVPVQAVEELAKRVPVRPGSRALAVAQDRLAEKQFFTELGLHTAAFQQVDSLDALKAAHAALSGPGILKTRHLGYDGKGQAAINQASDIEPAWRDLGGQPLLLEQRVSFRRELSVLIVRSTSGETAIWPLSENRHVDGILHSSLAPARASGVEAAAGQLAEQVVAALDYHGVLAIELFELDDGQLLINEMAPRVHNSGHWTIDGADCSQFENHLRAIAGWPLGSTAARGVAAMANWIGALPARDQALRLGAHWHDYRKAARPGRKVGHATVVSPDHERAEAALADLLGLAAQPD